MGMFLNTAVPYEAYKTIASTRFFVDKSLLIAELLEALERDGQKYVCITRPRRFGKTIMANMIAAFLGKAADSSDLFHKPELAGSEYCRKHMNMHDVIYIDFSRLPEQCNSYEAYISRILNSLKEDIRNEYPEMQFNASMAVWDILLTIFQKTRKKFVFVIDEWDAIFHMPFVNDAEQGMFLDFLKSLLKDQEYIELVYMTGILPIAKYSDGSELNMFDEYDMAVKEKYGSYFGFSEEEVDTLFEVYLQTTRQPRISRAALAEWYDGYHTASGDQLYNPRSVVCALRDNQLANYWTSSGTYDSIFNYIKENITDVRDDLVLMVSGERVTSKMQEYAVTARELLTRDQIYSAMVIYGLLTYENGEVFIPNRELMDKFNELLLSNESLGYVHRLAKESTKMLNATLCGDTETMSEILEYAHNTESPIFSYNSEIELSAVVNLIYLAARDKYHIEREDKTGKGYVDFIFYPVKPASDGIILELKVDNTPEKALRQIKARDYLLKFQGRLGDTPRYTGRILAVGMSYDRKTKKHSCKVEILRNAL